MNNYTNNRIAVTLPSISLPSATLPRTYLPRVKLPRLPALSYGTTETRRHVKDLGDLILGNPISGTRQLRDTLRDANMSEFLYTPILNRIVGAGLMLKERTLDPIIQGKPGIALVNALETMGYSADLLANPIKSLMPWAGGGSTDAFFRSMGWLEGAYREQYQWNTGNKIIDIIGEVVSDPVTWITFGSSVAAKSFEPGITTTLQQAATEQLTKRFGADIVKDKLIQQYIKELSAKSIKNISDDLINQLVKKYGPDIISDTTIRAFLSEYGTDALNIATKDLTKENSFIVRRIIERVQDQARYYTDQLADLTVGTAKYTEVQKLLNMYNTALKNIDQMAIDLTVLRQSDLYAKYLKIKGIGNYTKYLENKYILAPGRWLTGVGEATYTFKKFYKSNAYNVLRTNMLSKLNKMDPQEFVGNPAEVTRRINREVLAHNAAMYKDTYDSLKQRLVSITHSEQQANTIIQNMQRIAEDVFANPKYANKTLRQLNLIYMVEVVRKMPVLSLVFSRANGTNFEQLFNIDGMQEISLDDFLAEIDLLDQKQFRSALRGNEKAFGQIYEKNKSIFEAVHALAAVNGESTARITNAYIELATQILNNRFNPTTTMKDFKEFTGLEQLRVLFEDVIPQVAQAIGYTAADGIPILSTEFLTALKNKDEILFLRLNALLNYLGISEADIPVLNRYIREYSELSVSLNKERTLFNRALKREYQLLHDTIKHELRLGHHVPEPLLGYYNKNQLNDYINNYISSLLDKSTGLYKEYTEDLRYFGYPRRPFLELANKAQILKEFEDNFNKQSELINNTVKDLISKNVLDRPYTVPNAIAKSKGSLPYLGQTILKRYELDEQQFLGKVEQIVKEYHTKVKVTSTDFVKDIKDLQELYGLELINNKANEPLAALMNALDSLLPVNDYEQPASTTLKRLFKIIEELDNNPLLITEYKNELDEIEAILKKWKSSLEHSRKISDTLHNTDDISAITDSTILNFVRDLNTNLDTHKQDFIEIFDNTEGMFAEPTGKTYTMLTSKVEQANLIQKSIQTTFANNPEFLKEISDPNSILRHNLKQVIGALEEHTSKTGEQETAQLASSMKKVLAKIDAQTALFTFLDMDFTDIFEMPSDISTVLQGYLLGALISPPYSKLLIEDISDDIIDELVDNFKTNYRWLLSDRYKHKSSTTKFLDLIKAEYKDTRFLENIDDLNEAYAIKRELDRLKNTASELLTDTDYDRIDELEVLYDNYKSKYSDYLLNEYNKFTTANLATHFNIQTIEDSVDAVGEVVKTKLLNYRNNIAGISKDVGAYNLRLYNVLDSADSSLMNQLGEDHDLIEAIIKENIENNHQVLLETNRFLLHTAGSRIIADLENTTREFLEVLHIDDLEKQSTMDLINELNTADTDIINAAEVINKHKQQIIDNAILSAHEGSLSYAIYDACRNIGTEGDLFRGAKDILAKAYGPYKAKKYMNILNIMYQQDALQLIQDTTVFESIYEFNAATPYAFKKINFRLLNLDKSANPLQTFNFYKDRITGRDINLSPNIQVSQNRELVIAKLRFFMADNLTNIYEKRLGLNIDNVMRDEDWQEFTKPFLESNYRDVLVDSLQEYYTNYAKGASITITDPYDFFYKMTDAELLTWHRYTSSLYFRYNTAYRNVVATKKAALQDALKEAIRGLERDQNTTYVDAMKNKTKNDIENMYQQFIEEVETENNDTGIVSAIEHLDNSRLQPDSTDFDAIINKPREQLLNQLNYIIDYQCAYVKRPLKQISSLQDAHNMGHAVANAIKEDATAMERNKLYGDMIQDTRTIKEAYPNLSKEDIEVLKSYNIDYEKTQLGDNVVQKLAKHNLDHLIYNSVMRFNPQQLRALIDHNTDGIMFFVDPTSTFLKQYSQAELDAAGIIYKELKFENSGIYIIRRTSQEMHDADLVFDIPKGQIPVLQDIYDKVLDNMNKNQVYFNRRDMYAPTELFAGDMLSRQSYNMVLQLDEVAEFVGDLEVQKSYRKIDDLGQNLFHVKNIDRPNWTILGYEDPLNYILNNYVDDLQTNNHYKYAFTPTRLDKLAWQGSTRAINEWNTEHKYLQLFFDNDDVSLDGPVFKQILMNATDEELDWFFNRNHWDACILRKNRSGQLTVYRIGIHNHKQLLAAMDAGASCLSHEAYRNVALSINNHKITSKFINAYQTVLAATFKTLYLTNLGFFVRNFTDSNLYKDLNSSEGFLSVIDNFKYQIQARKMLDEYDDLVRRATKNGVLNQDVIRELLKQVPEEKRKIYMFMDLYMNTGAGGGQIRSLQQFLLNYNKRHGEISPTYQWAEWYREHVLGNKLIAGLNYINNDIEQTARLALFLNMMDNGEDYYNAIKKVIDTHFDYELKEPGLALFDQLCWFSTFPINNFFYYANEGMTKNPELYKLQLDLLQLSWNDGTNYTWDDVRNSKYLTYNALAGNLRFNIFGKNIVLKTGSSLMDFMNIALNPVGELENRLNPFISTLIGIDDISELNPLKAPYNRAKQIFTGQSFMPSLYATLYPKAKRRNYYRRKTYYPRSYHSSRFKISKRPIRIYPDSFIAKQMRRRNHHYLSSRYYTKRWNPKITRHLSAQPYYNPEEGRTAGAYARYTRQMKKVGQNKKRH